MCNHNAVEEPSKRSLFKYSAGAAALALFGAGHSVAFAASLTKAQRDKMTPDDVIASLAAGNKRFITNTPLNHDYRAQKLSSQHGQHPAAVLLTCIDSRVPAEIILDVGIGDMFNSRVAGNVANPDLLGSMEFACAVAGAKVVLVMGHTKCGAVQGAIADVKLGNLSHLLDKIKPAIAKTVYEGDRNPDNDAFVDEVARTNVLHTLEQIRKDSSTLAQLERNGKIKLVGAMYNISNGVVDFF